MLLGLLLFANVAHALPKLVPPQIREQSDAPYPPDGKGDAIVVLTLLVDASGDVTTVTVREGAPPFSDAAVASVKGWKFAPATRDDAPVSARISAVITFHAPRQAPAIAEPKGAPPATSASTTNGGAAPPPKEELIEVVVKGEHEELGTIHIPRSETRLIPGAFGDPFRVVEALPGMSPWLSGLPYFFVRGMSPENVGYAIDGIRVPLLFHVGSGPASIAPAMVDSVDLFPAAYPARYGRSAGAIIAGETTAPTFDHARSEFQVRVFDANAFGEAPIDDGKGSVLAAARYGYTGPLLSLIEPDYKLGYWDYQFRIAHRIGDDDTLSLFVFGSYDDLEFLHSPQFHVQYHRADLRYDHRLKDGNLRVAATFNFDDSLSALQTPTGTGLDAALRSAGGRVRAEYERHLSETTWLRAGADLAVSRFDVDRDSGTIHTPHTDVESGVYADVVWRPLRSLEIVPGARIDEYHVRGADTIAPQPRISAKVKITDGVSWISAAGTAHQAPTDEVFVPAKLPQPIDESARDSFQYSEALEAQLPWRMVTRATGYYTELRATEIAAHERSYGLELFLRRDFTQRLGGFASYTLSGTELDSEAGTYPRAPEDRTHLVSVVLGYDLGRNWRVGTRFFYESGRAFTCTAITCVGGDLDARVAIHGNLPAFYRIDARLEKRWNFSNGRWLGATLECFNALDKSEVTGMSLGPRGGLETNVQNAIILPSVGFDGGF